MVIINLKSLEGIDVTDFFEKFLKISKGLTDNTENKCPNILTNNKALLIKAIEDMIRNKKDLFPILVGVSAQLFLMDFLKIVILVQMLILSKKLHQLMELKRWAQI